MPQIAGPIAAAVKAVILAVAGTSTVATAAAQVASTAILALGGASGVGSFISAWGTVASFASLAMGPPKVSAGSSGGPVGIKLDPEAPAPIVLGRTAAGGNIVYRNTWGRNNRYLGVLEVLSIGGPVEDIEEFWVNGEQVPSFTGTPPAATGNYADFIWQYEKLGDHNETAFTFTAADWDGETPPGWTSAHKLSGMAKVFTIFRWKKTAENPKFPGGMPKHYTVLKGVKAYDPRKDSTYPGGSGSHRLATPSTWEWTENPYLIALKWLYGLYANGVRVAGVGSPWASIDVAAYVAGANVADANGWTVGGVVNTADDKWEVLAAILQAGGGLPISLGATISCLVKTPKTSTFNVTAADVTSEVEIVNTLPRRARFNRVIPKFRSEDHAWQVVPAAAISVAAYLTADAGEIRTREVSLPLVQAVDQAAQLAYYDLADTREGLVFTVNCGPRMLNARVGDCCTVQLPTIGYASQKCLVIGREVDPMSLQVTLTLRSETDAKHALALSQTGTAPPAPSLPVGDPSTIDQPDADDWTATGGLAANGAPAVILTGTVDNDMAVAMVVEYKKAADSTWIPFGGDLPASTTRVEIAPLASNTSYDTRVSYRNSFGALSTPRTEAAVTTGVGGQGGAVIPVYFEPTYPLSAPVENQIAVAAHTAHLPDGSAVSHPSATLSSGVLDDTTYGVFRDRSAGAYVYSALPSSAHMADPDNILIGWQRTQVSGGGFTAPDPPPSGTGGSGGFNPPNIP